MLQKTVSRHFTLRADYSHLSSFVTSRELRRLLSPGGNGGGDDDGPGEVDFWREDRLEPREGVRYGVSVGVGREAAAAAAYSSSVSHSFISTDLKEVQA
jgi:hypothetical protein